MDARDARPPARRWWSPALAGLCALAVATACTSVAGGAQDDPTTGAATMSATSPAGDAATSIAPSPSQTATPPAKPVTADDAPANAGALDFTARRLDGGTIDGAQLAGGPVALWMWAPWCPQCNREAPHVAEVLRSHGDRVTFVGMAGHDTDEAHRGFVEEHGLDDMLHVVDEDGSLWSQYGVSYQPAWVFVHEDGTTDVVAGGLYDDLEPRLQALLDR